MASILITGATNGPGVALAEGPSRPPVRARATNSRWTAEASPCQYAGSTRISLVISNRSPLCRPRRSAARGDLEASAGHRHTVRSDTPRHSPGRAHVLARQPPLGAQRQQTTHRRRPQRRQRLLPQDTGLRSGESAAARLRWFPLHAPSRSCRSSSSPTTIRSRCFLGTCRCPSGRTGSSSGSPSASRATCGWDGRCVAKWRVAAPPGKVAATATGSSADRIWAWAARWWCTSSDSRWSSNRRAGVRSASHRWNTHR